MDTIALEVTNSNQYLLYATLFMMPILLHAFSRCKANNSLHLPPGPRAWPIIGNILDLDGEKTHTCLANLAEIYGPLISLRLGSKLIAVASSPATAREILKTHDQALSGRLTLRISNVIPGVKSSMIVLSAECNQRWRFLRSTARTELFSCRALESHSKLRAEKVQNMLDFLGLKGGVVVAIVDVLYATIVNILTNTMMSKDIINLKDNVGELRKFSRSLVELAVPSMADIFPLVGALDFQAKRKARDYKERNEALWADTVSERRGKQDCGTSGADFLDVLIQQSFDDCEIFNLFNELFVTSDSVSTTLGWAMSELTKNQNAMLKLRDEITNAIGGTGLLSESQLAKLPYLQACIKETLRLHPPSPFLVPHCAVQSCKVMDYDIPKNSLVVVNAYAIGRDHKTWEDPLSFKPERFLGKNLDLKGTHYELLPFGAGRRNCIGYPLALKQIQLVLASLVHTFDWFLPSGMDPETLDMSDEFRVPMRRASPLLLILEKRNHLRIV
nr:probable (S)-N-methylcoclaurine 3'-hydroxylase isozyme 2 isoform X1 [Coffea arabica]